MLQLELVDMIELLHTDANLSKSLLKKPLLCNRTFQNRILSKYLNFRAQVGVNCNRVDIGCHANDTLGFSGRNQAGRAKNMATVGHMEVHVVGLFVNPENEAMIAM